MTQEMNEQQPEDPERREFLAKAISVIAGGTIVSIPIGAGLATLVSPLRGELFDR